MTPTFAGRIQTRLLLAVVVGVPVALLVGALAGGLSVAGALLALALLTVLGLGWECVYHLVQRRRWDGDWPSSFAFGAGVVEAPLAYAVLRLGGAAPGFGVLMLLFAAVWIAAWLATQGPVAVFLPHWRHHGSRVLPQRSAAGAEVRAPVAAPASRLRLPTVRMTVPGSVPGLSLPAGGLADLARPTRQRLVVLGGVAAMVVAVLLLAPLVGSRGDRAASTPVAHGSVAHPTPRAAVRQTTWDTTHRIRPVSLSFPAAGVHAVLAEVRMTATGALGTPRAGLAAWFSQGAAPGQRGPAVIIGDSANVFAHLGRVRPGQRFTTTRSDASTVRFVVDHVETVGAGQFPSREVYGHSLEPLARLIGYDTVTGRNVIVFAHAVAVIAPTMRS